MNGLPIGPLERFRDFVITPSGAVKRPKAGTYRLFAKSDGLHAINASGNDIGIVVGESALAFSDVTTANASTSKHGLLPKLTGGTTNFLREDGTWATPAGGGGGGGSVAAGYVQSGGNAASGASYTITLGSTPTNGHKLLLVAGSQSGTGHVTAVTQTNVVWTELHHQDANSASVSFWIGAVGASAGTSIAVTHNAGSFSGGAVIELASITGTVAQSVDATGTSDWPRILNFVPTSATSVLLAGAGYQGGSSTDWQIDGWNYMSTAHANSRIVIPTWTRGITRPIDWVRAESAGAGWVVSIVEVT